MSVPVRVYVLESLLWVAVPMDVPPSLKVMVPAGVPRLLLPVTLTESVVEFPSVNEVELAVGVDTVGTAVPESAETRLLMFTDPSPVAVS